ncbi:MAG: glycoside hydrolase family 16 protein, partial [Richelia sp. RM1_1_1]|nr:glycoside hydrolase family 16 protein [Richelia sp. RM1_1_1]
EFRYTGSRRGYGIVKAENCYLDNAGHLIIEAKKADTVYHIGQVGTQKTFLVQYGYFECSVQLITQVGSSCSFWLQSPSFGKIIDDPAKSGTEIDIFEYRKKVRNDEVHHTIHWNGYGEFHEQHGKVRSTKELTLAFILLDWNGLRTNMFLC